MLIAEGYSPWLGYLRELYHLSGWSSQYLYWLSTGAIEQPHDVYLDACGNRLVWELCWKGDEKINSLFGSRGKSNP